MSRVVILDSLSIFYRYQYALPKFFCTLPSGEKLVTGGLFGVTKFLVLAIRDWHADSVILAGESASATESTYSQPPFYSDKEFKSHRHLLYPKYKSGRNEIKPDVLQAIKFIPNIAMSLGVPFVAVHGYEADDILGTVAKHCKEKNLFSDIRLVSSDKDLLQHVNPITSVFDIKSYENRNEKFVLEKYGIKPIELKELMALVGDAADSIPGVDGIGIKTASCLVSKYSNLENIYSNLEAIPSKISTRLQIGKESAFLSRELFTSSCPNLNFDSLIPDSIVSMENLSRDKFKQLLQETKMSNQIKKI